MYLSKQVFARVHEKPLCLCPCAQAHCVRAYIALSQSSGSGLAPFYRLLAHCFCRDPFASRKAKFLGGIQLVEGETGLHVHVPL